MLKIFNWYLMNDVDKKNLINCETIHFKNRNKFLEKENFKQYKKIKQLEEENLYLKNHQKIEIIDLGSSKECLETFKEKVGD